MKLNVTYREAEPTGIESSSPTQEYRFKFTIEGSTARLVDVRCTRTLEKNESAVDLMELNQVHDAILDLPFIDRVTVWMKGRTNGTQEVPQMDS